MNKHTIKWLFLGCCFLFLVGCSTQKKASNKLSSQDQALVWSGERKKVFGQYDYTNLTSENEAKKILTEKFQVEVPSFFEKSKELLNKNDFLNAYTQHQTTYDVVAQDDKLTYRQVTEYQSDKNAVVRAVIETTFLVTGEEEVKTSEQTVTISTVASETTKFYTALPALSKGMAKILSLPNADQEIDKAFKKYPMHDTEKHVEAINIMEQKASEDTLSKKIQLFYDGDGTVTEWHTSIQY